MKNDLLKPWTEYMFTLNVFRICCISYNARSKCSIQTMPCLIEDTI